MNKTKIPTIFSTLDLTPITPRTFELLERRPRLVSALAAETFALLTRAAKPAKPFNEEPDMDLFATLANTVCLTRAGEVRQIFLFLK